MDKCLKSIANAFEIKATANKTQAAQNAPLIGQIVINNNNTIHIHTTEAAAPTKQRSRRRNRKNSA